MKTTWKKLLVLPLIFAIAAGPLGAESVNSADTPTNAAEPATPAPPPEPPAPPTPSAPSAPSATSKKSHGSSDHDSVRIGPNGIHIGGSDPVDIEMPDFSHGMPGRSWIHEFVAVVAIVAPFVFVLIFAALFYYFRQRRQRMLHETLRAMLDKGVPIPPELLAPQAAFGPRRARSDLRSGLIMLGVGVGLLLSPLRTAERFGWIPVLIGVAFLVTWLIEKNNSNGPTIK